MNDVLLQDFMQLISANTGLHIREQDKRDLSEKLHKRMKLLKLSAPEQYYQLLNTCNYHNSLGQTLTDSRALHWTNTERDREWEELTFLLTIGETYFFRDHGQIALLRNRILPELIESKRSETKRSLRIWSAGCSTGEELYSLAILVKELIPDWNKWNILILGTDINSQSIEKAKQGIYDSWSFRMVEPKLKQRYFKQQQTKWEVDQQIRSMVKFCNGNLLADPFPNATSDIYNMDIIVCRNVFIYFNSQTISVILKKFYNTLNSQGYLIAGHTELYGQNLGQLQAKVFPESVVYQRSEEKLGDTQSTSSLKLPQQAYINSKDIAIAPTSFSQPLSKAISKATKLHLAPNKTVSGLQPVHSVSPLPSTKETTDTTEIVLSQAEALFKNGDYQRVIKELEQITKQHPNNFDAYYLMAQAFANLGDSKQATEYCQQALKLDASSVAPYYLLAHIAEEQGNSDKAKDLFKKIIYLAPSSISAYLELGGIYDSEGDTSRARKMRTTALELLKVLPPNSVVEYHEGITVSELIIHTKKLLKK